MKYKFTENDDAIEILIEAQAEELLNREFALDTFDKAITQFVDKYQEQNEVNEAREAAIETMLDYLNSVHPFKDEKDKQIMRHITESLFKSFEGDAEEIETKEDAEDAALKGFLGRLI